jgi:hypothetical protein
MVCGGVPASGLLVSLASIRLSENCARSEMLVMLIAAIVRRISARQEVDRDHQHPWLLPNKRNTFRRAVPDQVRTVEEFASTRPDKWPAVGDVSATVDGRTDRTAERPSRRSVSNGDRPRARVAVVCLPSFLDIADLRDQLLSQPIEFRPGAGPPLLRID